MAINPLADLYSKRKQEFENSLRAVTTRINFISNLRIAAALAIILFIYLGYSTTLFLYLIPFLIIAFFVLVQYHGKAFDEKIHLQNLVKINANETALLKGDLSVNASGDEFSDALHPYSHDLDLF